MFPGFLPIVVTQENNNQLIAPPSEKKLDKPFFQSIRIRSQDLMALLVDFSKIFAHLLKQIYVFLFMISLVKAY